MIAMELRYLRDISRRRCDLVYSIADNIRPAWHLWMAKCFYQDLINDLYKKTRL